MRLVRRRSSTWGGQAEARAYQWLGPIVKDGYRYPKGSWFVVFPSRMDIFEPHRFEALFVEVR